MRYISLKVSIAFAAMLVAPGQAISAGASTVKSEVRGLSFVPLRTLPRSPEHASLDESCDGYRSSKLSDLGQAVSKLGWIVTSQAQLGRYNVVTFVSGFDAGTSGLCFARNANIAIFDGKELAALAYSSGPNSTSLGVVEPLQSGALLIWTDPPGIPVGELRADAGSLRITPVSAAHSFCEGEAEVPNIYGRSIDVARKMLSSYGWQPERPSEQPGAYDIAKTLAQKGLIEAESCSGTGVGYCSFNYRGSAGMLAVTTVGGDTDPSENHVAHYNVSCADK